jgi:hypothetical protein
MDLSEMQIGLIGMGEVSFEGIMGYQHTDNLRPGSTDGKDVCEEVGSWWDEAVRPHPMPGEWGASSNTEHPLL